jgi:hypothetical protein
MLAGMWGVMLMRPEEYSHHGHGTAPATPAHAPEPGTAG